MGVVGLKCLKLSFYIYLTYVKAIKKYMSFSSVLLVQFERKHWISYT